MDTYLDVLSDFDLPCISAILFDNLFLVWHILNPMNVLGSAASHLAFHGTRTQACKDQDWSPSSGSIMHSSSQTLCTNINMDDHTLGLAGVACISICHGEGDHLDNRISMGSLLSFMSKKRSVSTSFGHVIILGNRSFRVDSPLTIASMIEGWSVPRLTTLVRPTSAI
jgi:hypothetical protein